MALTDVPPTSPPAPFAAFSAGIQCQTALRRAITAAYRRSEPACVAPLLCQAELRPDAAGRARQTASDLVERLRGKAHAGPIEDLMQEYALSSRKRPALDV